MSGPHIEDPGLSPLVMTQTMTHTARVERVDVGPLVAWLRVQVDEDERVTRAAQQDWIYVGVATTGVPPFVAPDLVVAHIARHGPSRVLAEVAAKRAVLDEWDAALAQYQAHHGDAVSAAWVLAAVRTVRRLGLAYADQLGYDEAWRP